MRWPIVNIGKLCVPTQQRDPRLAPNEIFLYIDISTIDKDAKAIAIPQKILGSEAPSRARKAVRAGDVLVSTVRPNLNAVALVPPELDGQITSTGFCVLRPRSDLLHSRYLFYRTLTPDYIDYLTARMRGANYPAVTDEVVKSAPIPLPSPSEQRRIVEILDQADALRKKRAEADAKAERILPAFFYGMFGDPVTNPKGWDVRGLRELCTKITSGSRGWAMYTGHGDSLFVRTQDVNDGEISTSLLPVDPPPGPEADRTRLADRDIVITITGVVGKAAVFQARSQSVYVSQHVALIRPKSILEPEYLVALANFPLGQVTFFARSQYGQTKPGLGFRELQAAKIPLPPIGLQKRFASHVEHIRALKRQGRKVRADLDKLWAVLLNRAFSGDLTVKWREAHMKELLAEMEEQAKVLNAATVFNQEV